MAKGWPPVNVNVLRHARPLARRTHGVVAAEGADGRVQQVQVKFTPSDHRCARERLSPCVPEGCELAEHAQSLHLAHHELIDPLYPCGKPQSVAVEAEGWSPSSRRNDRTDSEGLGLLTDGEDVAEGVGPLRGGWEE
eukprot:scaffold202145_cov29-Tisochrysis_lutea.AAC.6